MTDLPKLVRGGCDLRKVLQPYVRFEAVCVKAEKLTLSIGEELVCGGLEVVPRPYDVESKDMVVRGKTLRCC